ncbi:Ribosome-inactivating protein dianthin-30 [Frankliniella fusca]|uniref:Ribosome-inactivating protein dianthin-30 n=1 Tax=Frankliniella fusca TaxID=407009 RepID=A0AAE1HBT6_9NEOP|nr:Ribosome-inactivating protein dianthin-30 [Frankliniella fusca]
MSKVNTEGAPAQKKSKTSRCSRINTAQTEELVAYMCKHPGFAKGTQLGYDGTRTKEEMWNELKSILDPLGGEKDVDQWSTSWRDIKSKATSHAAALRRDRQSTGNKEAKVKPLNETELKIVGLFGNEYSMGSNVPDAMPEATDIQQRLAAGDTMVLELEPEINDENEFGGASIVNVIACDNSNDIGEKVDNPGVSVSNDSETLATPNRRDPYLRRNTSGPQGKTPRTLSKEPRKERIGIQLENARINFEQLCSNQTSAMQLLAEAAMKQATAAEKQADAALLQARNEQRRIELQSANEERIITAFGQVTEVMNSILLKLNEQS